MGRRRIDVTGRVYDRLTVALMTTVTDGHGATHTACVCRCVCGEWVLVRAHSLTTHGTRSCGCLQRDRARAAAALRPPTPRTTRDLGGQRFGRLVVVEATAERVSGSVVWRCACDCGGEHLASSRSLTQGVCRSCGCLRRRRGVMTSVAGEVDNG